MSFGKSKPTTTTQSSFNKVNLPEWIRKPMEDALKRAETLSNQPFTPYDPNERVAPLSADEQAAFDLIRANAGVYSPFAQDAMMGSYGLMGRILGGPSTEDIESRMNPYLQSVLQRRQVEAERAFDVQNQSLGDLAAGAGAYGGSRMAVAQDELSDQFLDRLSGIQADETYNAFNSALGQFNLENQLGMQGFANLSNIANQGVVTLGQEAGLLQGAGQQSRMIDQALRDAKYEEFGRAQSFPYEQINFLTGTALPMAGIYQNNTKSQQTTTQSEGGGGSLFGDILGTGLSIAAMGIPGGGTIGSALLGSMGTLGAGGMGPRSPGTGLMGALGRLFFAANGGQVPSLYADGGTVSFHSADYDLDEPMYPQEGSITKRQFLEQLEAGLLGPGVTRDEELMWEEGYGPMDQELPPREFLRLLELSKSRDVPKYAEGGSIRRAINEVFPSIEGNRAALFRELLKGTPRDPNKSKLLNALQGYSAAPMIQADKTVSALANVAEPAYDFVFTPESVVNAKERIKKIKGYMAEGGQKTAAKPAGTTEQGVPVEKLPSGKKETAAAPTAAKEMSIQDLLKDSGEDAVKERYGNTNLPLLLAGIAMMTDDGDSVWDSIGAGFRGFAEGKEAVYQTKKDAKAAQLEGILTQAQLAKLLAETNKLNAEAASGGESGYGLKERVDDWGSYLEKAIAQAANIPGFPQLPEAEQQRIIEKIARHNFSTAASGAMFAPPVDESEDMFGKLLNALQK